MAKEKVNPPVRACGRRLARTGARCERLIQSTKSEVPAIHPIWVLAYYLHPLPERGANRAAPGAESLRPYLGAESRPIQSAGTVCRPELPSPQFTKNLRKSAQE